MRPSRVVLSTTGDRQIDYFIDAQYGCERFLSSDGCKVSPSVGNADSVESPRLENLTLNAPSTACTTWDECGDPKSVLLHITHHWGGGTEQHVQEIIEHLGNAAMHLVLHSRADGFITLSEPGRPDLVYHPRNDFSRLVDRLRRLGVTRIHVHQLFTVPVDVRHLIDQLDVEFDFTVHDYHTLCPRVHFKTRDDVYCGEPNVAGCAACLDDWHHPDERDIVAYRARYAWVHRRASRIICPSRDVAVRMGRYVGQDNLVVAPHPRRVAAHPAVSARPVATSEPLQVAVLGWVTAFKGAARVLDTAGIVSDRGLPIRLRVIGTIDGATPPGLDVTGPYETQQLRCLLTRHRPHLIWYPAQVPETYSYTLTEGLEAGLPIVVPRLGAFPERVSGRPWSWIVDWNLTPDQAVDALMAAREHFVSGVAPAPPVHEVDSRAGPAASDFYRSGYLGGTS